MNITQKRTALVAVFVLIVLVAWSYDRYNASTDTDTIEQGCVVFTNTKLIINGTMIQVTEQDACCCTSDQSVCACDGSGDLFYT